MALKSKRLRSGMKILIQEDSGFYRLMVESKAGVNPAGWRLNRGGDFPISEFEFFDVTEAIAAGVKLQDYLNKC